MTEPTKPTVEEVRPPDDALLVVRGLVKHFRSGGGFLGGEPEIVRAEQEHGVGHASAMRRGGTAMPFQAIRPPVLGGTQRRRTEDRRECDGSEGSHLAVSGRISVRKQAFAVIREIL